MGSEQARAPGCAVMSLGVGLMSPRRVSRVHVASWEAACQVSLFSEMFGWLQSGWPLAAWSLPSAGR